MPGPGSDEEIDSLLGLTGGAVPVPVVSEKLPVAPVPPVPPLSAVPELAVKPNPETDAEIEAMLTAPAPAPVAPQAPAEGVAMGRGTAAPTMASGRATGRGLAADAVSEEPWYKRLMRAPGEYADSVQKAVSLPDGYYQDPNNLTDRESQEVRNKRPVDEPFAPGHVLQAVSMAYTLPVFKAAQGAGKLSQAVVNAGNQGITGGVVGGAQSALAGNDLGQIADDTIDNAALAAGGTLLGEGAGAARQAFKDSEHRLMTQTFLTAPQRGALKAAKGNDALTKLGADAEAAGLFKNRNWMDYLRPADAARVAENAENVMKVTAGPRIGQFEDDLVKTGTDPFVDYKPISDSLRGDAAEAAQRSTLSAAKNASAMNRQADVLTPNEDVKRWLPREMSAEQQSLPLAAPEPIPAAKQAGVYGLPDSPPPVVTPPEPQMSFPGMEREELQMSLPGTEAVPQTSAQFGSNIDVTNNLPAQTELADKTLGSKVNVTPPGQQNVLANDPAWDKAIEPPPVPVPAAPQQLAADLGTQGELFPGSKPQGIAQTSQEPWTPGDLRGVQEPIPLGMSTQPERSEVLSRPRPGRNFSEAVKDKRALAEEINWNKSKQAGEYGEEAAAKGAWSQLKEQMDKSLEGGIARGEIDPAAVQQYRKDNKDFATAATAFDPAMRMAERNGTASMGVGDLITANAFGGGIDGGVIAVGSRGLRGKTGSIMASGARNLSAGAGAAEKALKGSARVIPALSQARSENPKAEKGEIQSKANSITKQELRKLMGGE